MSKTKKIILTIAIIILTLGLLTGGNLGLRVFLHNKYAPGTQIAGIDLGFKTQKQATEILEKQREQYLKTPIQISLDNTTLRFLPEELGIKTTYADAIEKAKSSKIDGKNKIISWLPDLGNGQKLDIAIEADNQKAINLLYEKFELTKRMPKEPTLYFEGNTLTVADGQSGIFIKEDELIKVLEDSAKTLTSPQIKLTLERKNPKTTKTEIEEQLESIQESLRHEFVLIDPVYSDDWYEALMDHISWVTFAKENEQIVIKIKQDELNKYIDEEISQWLDVPPEPVNIYTDSEGNVVIEGKGNNGLQVQRELLKEQIELAVAEKTTDIPIPIIEIKPEITVSDDLKELGIKDILGIGHTSYYGSASNRIHNIKTGSSKFNGTLVAPEETFSFLATLGAVDGSTGYRKELVIKKEGTIPEYGGGLCQVSTTFYRAILFSGLPVVKRTPHSYAVSYYSQVLGHGLDATIYVGGPDLQFLNDTGNHILIQAYTQGDYELYIIFYGTSDGRSVEMEGPCLSNYHSPGATVYEDTASLAPGQTKQVEISHTGFDALWYRYITLVDGTVEKETLLTKYKAIPAKILVGIDPNAEPQTDTEMDANEGPTI